MTPRGSYRDGLEKHLDETRSTPNGSSSAWASWSRAATQLQVFVGFAESLVSQSSCSEQDAV